MSMTSNEKKELTAKVGTGVVVGVAGAFFFPVLTGLGMLAWGGYEGLKWAKKNGKI